MRHRLLIWSSSALVVGGAVLLALYAWTRYESAAAQQRAKATLSRMTPDQQTVPDGKAAVTSDGAKRARRVPRGAVLGELEIPRLKVSVMVLEGDDSGILKLGAGHIPGTALLPSSGNIGIAAHRDTYFRPLRQIHVNDVINFKSLAGTSQYKVTDTAIVSPSNIGVLSRAPGRDLTLVTCYPFYYLGPAPERFIVHARKTG